jgi:membrane associated rhomboid family serine protease
LDAAESPERRKTIACPRCGALNGADFDRCIRCGTALSTLAASAERIRGSIDSQSLPATKLIVALTALVYAGQMYVAFRRDGTVEFLGRINPSDFLRFGGLPMQEALIRAEPWRLLSAVFVHIGLLHFGLNMYCFVDLGRLAERLIGPARFLIAYVVTGIVGFATTFVLSLFSPQGPGTAGASGAIFGTMGIIVGLLLRRRDQRWKDFAIRAVIFSLLLGFGLNAMNTGVRVNNSAHVGGLIAGVLFGLVFGGPRGRSDLWANVVAVACLLACVASLVLAQLSPAWRHDEFWLFSQVERPSGDRTGVTTVATCAIATYRVESQDSAAPP